MHSYAPTVSVIEHSIAANSGIEVCTLHLRYWRGIHAEFMTHRAFGRNARSSRAVPTKRLLTEAYFAPEVWGSNKSGMQAGEELTGWRKLLAKTIWHGLVRINRLAVRGLNFAGLHKQWANRPLEWFGWIDVIVTATRWNNFFHLRCHGDAQPEMAELADKIRDVMAFSTPRVIRPGEWHLPYIYRARKEGAKSELVPAGGRWAVDDGPVTGYFNKITDELGQTTFEEVSLEDAQKLSVARCARVSYAPFDGNSDFISEMKRYDRLVNSKPVHASPTEHQCTPDAIQRRLTDGSIVFKHPQLSGNLGPGFIQYRKLLPDESVPG